jgi:hypothetical protein
MLAVAFGVLTASQRKYLNIKPIHLKVPLILMTSAAGLLGSISMSFIKGVTDIYDNGGFDQTLFWFYFSLALSVGIL